MTTRIKICGLSTRDTVRAALDAGASHVGLNFYPPSPRFVTPARAAELASQVADRAHRVGVFVDPSDATLADYLAAASLDAIQLHAHESPERIAQIKARFGLPVWKVLSISGAEDIARATEYRAVADFLLFDTKTPSGALPGGMGQSFDWSLLKSYDGALPWGLAGGLNPGNVADAIRLTGAPLVDTSSGVESASGIKDVDLIAAFCKAARNV